MNMENNFDLDAFLAGMDRDKSKVKDPSNKLNKVLMNTKDTQGTVTFVPFLSKSFNNFYLKIPRVIEFNGETSLINSGAGWMKLLPIEFYGELNSDEIKLYQEVRQLLDELSDYELPFDEFRYRTYALFTGAQVSHRTNNGTKLDDLNDCACLYVFPSNSPIDAMNTAINSKIDAMKGKREWLSYIFSPNNTNRKGAIQISFTKSAGAGYDSNVSFEFNNDMNIIVDPDKVYSDEFTKLFDDALESFMGWNYDRTANRMFNNTFMREFKVAVQTRLDELRAMDQPLPEPQEDGQTYANKNNNDPQPESTSNAVPSQSPQRPTPF